MATEKREVRGYTIPVEAMDVLNAINAKTMVPKSRIVEQGIFEYNETDDCE